MNDLITVLVSGGLVAALLEALKRALGTHFDWTRFGALLALGVGVVTALAGVQLGWYPVTVSLGQAVFSGLMAGITASGLNRGISQSPATVVVEGEIPAQPATPTSPATPATTATAVVPEPAVTANADDAAVRPSLGPPPSHGPPPPLGPPPSFPAR